MMPLRDEFASLSNRAASFAGKVDEDLDQGLLRQVDDRASEVAKAWSGSNLGYQADVYYMGLKTPPSGAFFSREWGFLGQFQGTKGDWRIQDGDHIRAIIRELLPDETWKAFHRRSAEAREAVEDLIEEARSIAVSVPSELRDAYIEKKLQEILEMEVPDRPTMVRASMPPQPTEMAVRDMQALEGGWRSAPHQDVLGEIMFLRAPYVVARNLSRVTLQCAQHLTRAAELPAVAPEVRGGTRVFIGHGHSPEWRKLSNYLTTLGLDWDEYDREPVAGHTTVERLQAMLDAAVIAFVVLTGEDESVDGKVQARANVIHEVGLFQGRLGFPKAIAMLEEECEEFSNIAGLGQIRFPKNGIDTTFHKVRAVLEREGVIGSIRP